MKKIIDGKSYNTETATMIAGNDWWDGSNFDRFGRNMFLYKTKKGNFFLEHVSRWQGERDCLELISTSDAKKYFAQLSEHRVEWDVAFGDVPEEG